MFRTRITLFAAVLLLLGAPAVRAQETATITLIVRLPADAILEIDGVRTRMTGESRTATVVAKTDVECYVVDKDAFQEIVQEKPELAGIISDILSRRQVDLGAKRTMTPVPSAA